MEEDLFEAYGIDPQQAPMERQEAVPQNNPNSPVGSVDLFEAYGIEAPQAPVDKMAAAKDFLLDKLVRPAARVAKTGIAGYVGGAADFVGLALEAPIYTGYRIAEGGKSLYNKATGVSDESLTSVITGNNNKEYKPIFAGKSSEAIRQGFDKATGGMTIPRNKTEEYVDTAGEFISGGFGLGKIANMTAKGGGNLANKAKDLLKVETTQEMGALTGSSLAIPAAQDATQKGLDIMSIAPDSNLRTVANVAVGLGAGIGGGIAGAKATNFPISLKNYRVMKDLPKTAKVTAADLERSGMSADDALKELQGDAGIGLDPIDVNPAQIGNLKDLAQIAGSRKVLRNAFDEREQRVIKAQNNILKGVEADDMALVNLSQEYKQKLLKKRSDAARPLYKAGLAKGTKIPLDSVIAENISPETAGVLNIKSNQLTLTDVLQSPVIKSAITGARNKSRKFANTPAGEIYGNIHQKTKPVYETKTTTKDIIQNPIVSREQGFHQTEVRDVRLGAAATDIMPEYKTDVKLKNRGEFTIPDNDVRVLNAVDSILYDEIGQVGATGYTKEQTALKLVRESLGKILDQANPELKEARQIWKVDTQEILTQDKKTIGVITRLAADKYDEAAEKLSRLSPAEISEAKVKLMSIDAGKYSQAVKAYVDKRINSLKGNQELTKFFGSEIEKRKMRAMFPNRQAFDGFEKAINYIEKTKPVQDSLRRALDQEIKAVPLNESIPQREGIGAKTINLPSKAIKKGKELTGLSERQSQKTTDVKQAEILAKYSFTDEGKELFQELAKTKRKADIDQIMTRIYLQSGFLTTLSNTKPANEEIVPATNQQDYAQ